jgi:hypothetical protein
MQAAKSGGMKSWQPKCDANQQAKQRAKAVRPSLETALDELYDTFGNDRLTISQLAIRMGWTRDLTRCRVEILESRNLIKRNTVKPPYLYFRA